MTTAPQTTVTPETVTPKIAPHTALVELPTGVRLPYVERGDRDGVPVLFLHGFSDSWRSFEEVLTLLPTGVRAIAATQRGHGDADKPGGGDEVADFVADAVALLDALGIDAAVLVGHSMGGLVAQQVAIEHPERVLGLVLAGSLACLRENAQVAELAAVIAELEDPVDGDFVREFQASMFASEPEPAALDAFVAESLKVPARVWRAVMEALLRIDQRSSLGRITAPTLVVGGDQDEISGPTERACLLAGITGARAVTYEGVAHGLHWEVAARFAADVAQLALSTARS